MSRVDVRDGRDLVSPARARSLLTVRAAISFARLVDRPCFFSESLMCSYCRSRFELHASGIDVRPPGGFLGGQHMPTSRAAYSCLQRANTNGDTTCPSQSIGWFWTLCSVAY